MNLIFVMTKDTREAVEIDIDVVEDWKDKFDHLSGKTWKEIDWWSELSELQDKYQSKFDKEVPARYKNDESWILSKLSE